MPLGHTSQRDDQAEAKPAERCFHFHNINPCMAALCGDLFTDESAYGIGIGAGDKADEL
jgi:hypothetical protein